MNETIGQIGGSNDRRRRVKISKKMLQALKKRYELIKKQELEELEKKVKILQVITFFKSLAIILSVEQLKQIMSGKKETKEKAKDNELFEIKETPLIVKKEKQSSKPEKQVVINLLKTPVIKEKNNQPIDIKYRVHIGMEKEEKYQEENSIPSFYNNRDSKETDTKEENTIDEEVIEILFPKAGEIDKEEEISDTYEILELEEKPKEEELEKEKETTDDNTNQKSVDTKNDDSYYKKIFSKMDKVINKASDTLSSVNLSTVVDYEHCMKLLDKYKEDFKDIVDIDDLKYSDYYRELCYRKLKFEDIIKETKYELEKKHTYDDYVESKVVKSEESIKSYDKPVEKKCHKKTQEEKKETVKKEEKKHKKRNPLIMLLYGYSSMILLEMLRNKHNTSFLGSKSLAISVLVSIYIMNNMKDRVYDIKAVEEYKQSLEEEATDIYGILIQIERSLQEIEKQIITVEEEKMAGSTDPYCDMTLDNLYSVRDNLISRRLKILEQLSQRKQNINVKRL